MNREQLLKHWSVIEAFRNGKQLQYRAHPQPKHIVDGGGWADCPSPNFLLNCEYRVKPEKKELWLNVYPDRPASVLIKYNSKAEADSRALANRVACVKVVYEEGEGL